MSRFALGAVCAIVALSATPASADVITFEGSAFPFLGSFTFTSTSIAGSAAIDFLLYDPGSGEVVYDVDGPVAKPLDTDTAGRLDFFIDGCTTGQLFSLSCTPTASSSITILGSVPLLGLAEQTLLSGTFTGNASGNSFGGFQSASGSGTDTKSLALLEALGIDPATAWQFGFSVGEFIGVGTTVTNTSSDTQPPPVPEPTSLLLLGSGIAALTFRRRNTRV